jgi:hypothetical protein
VSTEAFSLTDDLTRLVLANPQAHAGARTQIHHLGYEVPDMSAAIDRWCEVFGIGPFLRLDNPSGNGVRPSFAWWGAIYVELMPSPRPDDELWDGGVLGRLDHVAYMTQEPAQESTRLDGLGYPKVREMQRGQVWTQHHDAPSLVSCRIELHQPGSDLAGLFTAVREAAENWDGLEREWAVAEPGSH